MSKQNKVGQAPASPARAGYAMPAEWQPHQATWLSWPHKRASWPGKFEPVEPVMVRFVAALSPTEIVRINVLDEAHERHVRNLLEGRAHAANVRFHRFPTNDAWCRDHGAIFVTRKQGGPDPLLALDFRFNSWGGKYPPFDLDDAIPPQMAAALRVPCRRVDMVLEGGSIEVNGAGALLTTEQCLLNPNRNPSMSRAEIEASLRDLLGVRQIIWLGDGIVGDDTDGHIDDLTRFVAEDRVVTVVEPDSADENHTPLAENRDRLDAIRLDDGRPLEVIELRMPGPVEFEGDRLPASYANFYIGNKVVLMPAFDDPADEPNRRALARCFPGREVIAIDCTDLVLGLGTFHCLTQQVPMV
ncbi:MAG: agmatine deiminase family protein [Gammaproteobacteria bacterium]|nr:agmatine deiminase family protein [Gammaproteobacteria bacterium]MDH4254144.1 agmatine deiminase family protein [Gammaproteobacteria bacterium]MDH5309489.1 agmatine deiminase family protein [Gammaproteobacteria bacterium]